MTQKRAIIIAASILGVSMLLVAIALIAQPTTYRSNAAQDPEVTPQSIIKSVKSEVVAKGCFYDWERESKDIFDINLAYSGAVTYFVDTAKKLFEDKTCKSYGFSLTIDGNIALNMLLTKENYTAINWDNLRGHAVYSVLKNSGVIVKIRDYDSLDTEKIILNKS